jgi:hypothetical protein
MEEKKVTRAELRDLGVGDTLTYHLTDYAQVDSGKNTAYAYAKVLGCRFTCSTEKTDNGYNLTIKKEKA